MRTNIVIDDGLVQEAFKYAGVKTKRELVRTALSEYVQNHGRRNLAELRGKIAFRRGYDYKKLRKGSET